MSLQNFLKKIYSYRKTTLLFVFVFTEMIFLFKKDKKIGNNDSKNDRDAEVEIEEFKNRDWLTIFTKGLSQMF